MDSFIKFLISSLEDLARSFILSGNSWYQPLTIEYLGERYGLAWGFDTELDEVFVSVGYNLPHDTQVFAEIEDGTYGQLQALRIYLPEASMQLRASVLAGEDPIGWTVS